MSVRNNKTSHILPHSSEEENDDGAVDSDSASASASAEDLPESGDESIEDESQQSESSEESNDDVNSNLESVMIKQYVLPLTTALRENQPIEVVQPLIDTVRDLQKRTGGAYLDAAPKYEHAPLLVACTMENPNALVSLLQSGADLHRTTSLGSNALVLAVQADSADIIRLLLRAGMTPVNTDDEHDSLLITAIEHNSDSDAVRVLLEHADCPLQDALHRACFSKNVSAVKLLLLRGVDVNQKDALDGCTPLMMTCSNPEPSIDVVNLLLQRGAQIAAVNNAGDSALHLLAPHSLANDDNKQITRILIDNGAPTDTQNNNGQTAADMIRELHAEMSAEQQHSTEAS